MRELHVAVCVGAIKLCFTVCKTPKLFLAEESPNPCQAAEAGPWGNFVQDSITLEALFSV